MAQVARDGGPDPKGDFTPKISPVLAVPPIDFDGKIRVYEFCCSWGTLFVLRKGELIDRPRCTQQQEAWPQSWKVAAPLKRKIFQCWSLQ